MCYSENDTLVSLIVEIKLYHYQNQISDIYFLQERGENVGTLKKLPEKLHAKNICFLYMHGQDATPCLEKWK